MSNMPSYGCSCGCGAKDETYCLRTPGWINLGEVAAPSTAAVDGEVVCKCGNKRLNRHDLNCWRCGGHELDRSRVTSLP